MTFGFLNALMLIGLAAVAIPPVVHLLTRRRYDVVDWGAMQFLQVSESTRRRLLIEEILLMLLRMGLIAVMVLGLAAPYAVHPALATLGRQPNRDVVLVFDGSDSMGFAGGSRTPHEAAQAWATAFIDRLAAGDRVAVLQAKRQVVPVLAEPTHDLERARQAVARLPAPRGGCDWPLAVQAAHQALEGSTRPRRDVIVLTDGQRFGWADESTLLRWELLAGQLHGLPEPRPRVWVVNVDPDRPADPPNWSLAPLRVSRAVASAGQEVLFRTALQLRGQAEYRPPYRLRLEVDGKPVRDLPPPAGGRLDKGQMALSFRHRFATSGSHLVSLVVQPDPPPEKRPPGYRVRDQLPGDNRQDLALEVVDALPVLLVDGDTRTAPRVRGADFLRDALGPSRDRTPVVVTRVVAVQDFDPALLERDLTPRPGSRPRVLVLSNVARLSPPQQEAVGRFLAGGGGGVLVALGERVDPLHYNDQLFRAGQGWLPARLDRLAGEEDDPDHAAHPLPATFFHPALDLFRETAGTDLADARFPRWWKVAPPGKDSPAVAVAFLTTNDPLLVERPYSAGRVLLCTVPLDNSWRTNLPELPAFVPLAHELVYYLAGARSAEHNVQPGQPLRYRPPGDEPPGTVTVRPPEGPPRTIAAAAWPLAYDDTRETGVYRLGIPGGRTAYYVVQPDPRESDLTPATDADRERVAALVPMIYQNDMDEATASAAPDERHELWWWFLLAVVGLLLGEIWLTRRMARRA